MKELVSRECCLRVAVEGRRAGRPAGLTVGEATLGDLPALVALNDPTGRGSQSSGERAFHREKLRMYLASPSAWVLVARVDGGVAGYTAVVVREAFARAARRPGRLLRQAWLMCSGGYGFRLNHLVSVARRAYQRLWRDPWAVALPDDVRRASTVAWVNNIVVAQGYRGRGIAGELLAAVEPAARGAGVDAIAADVASHNAASLRAFEKVEYQSCNDRVIVDGCECQVLLKWL